MSEIRVYISINAGTLTPTEGQWRSFFEQAATKPLAQAVLAAARASQNYITAVKRSLGSGAALKNTLLMFEVDTAYVNDVNTVLQAQATIRGVSGTVQQKFVGVLRAELREAAVDLGLTALQAQQITMTVVGYGLCGDAITGVQAYLATNSAVWHAAV